MGDIFDDVEETLAAEGMEDNNFNETELQDIMSEIEDLEKEFEVEGASMTLQDEIEAELQMEMDKNTAKVEVEVEEEPVFMEAVAEVETEVVEEDMSDEFEITEDDFVEPAGYAEVEEAAPVAQVLAFEKATPTPVATTTTTAKSEVSFEARGQMALNLDFKIGTESAKLYIDPIKGLTVVMSGVEVCINEETGCSVSMENGTKFTIPLSSQVNSLKKKTA